MNAPNAARRALRPDGWPERIALATITSAGYLYANIGPLIVSGLSRDLSPTAAGLVLSANVYGAAIGGLAALWLLPRMAWRRALVLFLGLLIGCDLASAVSVDATTLSGLRLAHGVAAGIVIGVSMSVIARKSAPDRTYALAIVMQLGLAGVGTAVIAPALARTGVAIVWLSLVGFSVLALALIPLLGDGDTGRDAKKALPPLNMRIPWLPAAAALLALFLFQAGEYSIFAFVLEIGSFHSLEMDFISMAVAIALWIGAPAALLVAWWSTRSGRFLPSTLGILFTAGSIALMLVPSGSAFFLGNVGLSVFYGLTIPYLLGVCSELDSSGRMGAVAGLVNNLGLATGPAVAAWILSFALYDSLLIAAVATLALAAILVAVPTRRLDTAR